MHRAIRQYSGAIFAIVTAPLVILGGIAIFVQDMQSFLEAAWAWGWVGFAGTIVGACIIWHIQDKSMQRLEREVDEVREALGGREDSAEGVRELTLERDDLSQNLEAARTQIRALQKPAPSVRDQELYDRLTSEWPWGSGTLFWLRDAFHSKTWPTSITRQIIHFVDVEGDLFFDDVLVDTPLREFRTACRELVEWLVTESSPDDYNTDRQVVHDGTYRPGGWTEYMEVRDHGEQLASAVVEAWRSFERAGRKRGL